MNCSALEPPSMATDMGRLGASGCACIPTPPPSDRTSSRRLGCLSTSTQRWPQAQNAAGEPYKWQSDLQKSNDHGPHGAGHIKGPQVKTRRPSCRRANRRHPTLLRSGYLPEPQSLVAKKGGKQKSKFVCVVVSRVYMLVFGLLYCECYVYCECHVYCACHSPV
jgi:hypothetical protein